MIMENKKNKPAVFLVLVPHRDTRSELQKYGESSDLTDVYSFPCVTPLAALFHPLGMEELKNYAKKLRKSLGTEKIQIFENSAAVFPAANESLTLIGPKITINTDFLLHKNEDAKEIYASASAHSSSIKNIFDTLVIGTWLAHGSLEQQTQLCSKLNSNLPSGKLSFRAAAIANMYWRSVIKNNEIAYKWKIEKLCWLPKETRLSKKTF
jgi:hypothetical protein